MQTKSSESSGQTAALQRRALVAPTRQERAARSAKQAVSTALWWTASLGSVIVLWEALAALGWINTTILPPPHETVMELISGEQFVSPQITVEATAGHLALIEAVLATIERVFAGIVLAFVGALLVGGLAFYFRLFGNLVLPTIAVLSPIAPIAWVPLAIVAFGIGDISAISVVFLGLFFILTLAVVNTMRGVEQVYINTARVLGATRFQILRHVILPAILPNLFVILRVNFFAAWMAVLAAEAVGVSTGLGMIIWAGRQMLNMKLTFLGMAMIGIVGFLLDQVLVQIQKRVLWWRGAARV